MKRVAFSVLVLIGICGWFCQNSYGQVIANKIKSFSTALNNIRELKPIEKLYLQTDKPYYSVGDTLRFKGYLLYADYFAPSTNSGLLYVELDNDIGKNVKRIMVPVNIGLAWGDMALDSTEIPNGTYTLRAYTNWMRNFNEDYIFKKTLTISKSTDNPLLVKTNFKQIGSKVEGDLQFSLLDGRIQAFKDVELKVINGRRNLSKNKVVTGADGTVKVNFTLPEGEKALSIQALTTGYGLLNIPILINRKENTDVQFMPEGGALVAGLPSRVGLKAIGEDGKGVAITGNVIDSKGNKVAAFASAHAGMGSFEFTPSAGEVYSAKVDGIVKAYTLPAVKPAGTTLAIRSASPDSLQVIVTSKSDVKNTYYLIAHSRGVVCYAQTVSTSTINKAVAKSWFPTGIVRFSLLNSANQPVNERIAFIDHHDDLRISVAPHQLSYGIRDSIALAIKVTDSKGNPVEGSFSLAVTDNDQVKQDSLGSNILSNLLLTSDLKGDIEDPGYYFTGNKETDLDNLMLTQGWVGYDWKEAFQPTLPFAFKPEKEFVVSGRVSNAFGKAIEKSNILLLSNHPVVFKDTLTGKGGRFVFKDIFPVDTAIFKLQARNKNNKEFNVSISIDETNPPVFNPQSPIKPWYLDTDSTFLNNAKNKIAETIALSNFRGEGNVLKEVNIKSKKIIKDSKNLNGPGEADFIIDEEEIKKKPVKTTLEELLREKFPAFAPQGRFWHWKLKRPLGDPEGRMLLPYVWNRQKIRFIFDGMDIDRFISEDEKVGYPRYNYISAILNYFTAEDIVGIEIMEQPKYTFTYNNDPVYTADCYAYIEVTTRAKRGPFMKVTPGTYLYKTLPFTLAKQFYSPKYTVKNKTVGMGTDLRSTIFWEPNVATDKDGKATLSFYSADKSANYTVIVEGANLDGALGFGRQQIKVK
jgi:hypothetical protein